MQNLYGSKFVRILRLLFPFPRPFPLSTFVERLWYKNVHIYSWFVLSEIHASGAKLLKLVPNELQMLELNRKSPLGLKGSKLILPKDKVIFEWVRRRGLWELEEVKFLSVSAQHHGQKSLVLIDIGGQAGLITRQILIKQEEKFKSALIVEPIRRHLEAIEYNCNKWISNGLLKVFPFALDLTNGHKVISIDVNNSGNSSLIAGAMFNKDASLEDVESRLVSDFEAMAAEYGSKYILKSDIQGMDAKILSQLSDIFWDGVEAAVIEIWALPEISIDNVAKLLEKWSHFTFVSWSPLMKKNTSLSQVEEFWTSKSGATRNLFLHR